MCLQLASIRLRAEKEGAGGREREGARREGGRKTRVSERERERVVDKCTETKT